MIRLIVNGAAGRMGRAVVEEILARPGTLALAGEADPKLGVSLAELSGPADAVIDFSSAAGGAETLEICRRTGWALVLAVTGESLPEEKIHEAAQDIALLRAPNLSQGAETLRRLAALADRRLGPEYDRGLEETHHREKKDAPSGTAKALLEAMKTKAVQVVALRAGGVAGVHEISFYGPFDVLTLRHSVYDRRLFARRAVEAALWLTGCAPGLYTTQDWAQADYFR